MASFDPEEAQSLVETTNQSYQIKYPMKRLELSVRNFIKVLYIDLDRLHKHTENIKKLTNAEDWSGLHREQVNASRTIQQINANIREIERARTQVTDEDVGLFDAKVKDVKSKALASMNEFMAFIGANAEITSHVDSKIKQHVETGKDYAQVSTSTFKTSNQTESEFGDPLSSSKSRSAYKSTAHEPHLDLLDTTDHNEFYAQENTASQYGRLTTMMEESPYTPAPITTSLHVAPQQTDASHSWDQLTENIVELNELVHHFAGAVKQQGEVLSTVDENIETASVNVTEGTKSLVQASKYKAAMYPVMGAVVGGVIGGPIGLMAGMKLGGLAGLAGGAAGFAGGRMLKKRQDATNNMEMQNLSGDRRSSSISDDNNDPLSHDPRLNPNTANTDNVLDELDLSSTSSQTDIESSKESGLTRVYMSVTSPIRGLFAQSKVQP